MWRDVLVVVAVVLTVLSYFGLTPRRLTKYADAAKAGLPKRFLPERFLLYFFMALSIVCVFLLVYYFDGMSPSTRLLVLGTFIALWYLPFRILWGLSRIAITLACLGIALLVTAAMVYEETTLGDRIVALVVSAGAIGAGFGLERLVHYVSKKLGSRHHSEEEDK